MKTVISNPFEIEVGKYYTISTPSNSRAEWLGAFLTGTIHADYCANANAHGSLFGYVGPLEDLKQLGKATIQIVPDAVRSTHIILNNNSFSLPVGLFNSCKVEYVLHQAIYTTIVAKAYLQILLGFDESIQLTKSDLEISGIQLVPLTHPD